MKLGWLVEGIFWAAGAFGIWLLTLSSVSGEELLVAAGCACLASISVTAARRMLGTRWRPVLRFAAPALLLPLSILSDSACLLATALFLRRRHSGFQTVETSAAGPSAAAASARAFSTLIVTSSPGTVVVDVERESGRAVVHSLGFPGPHIERLFEGRF